ncbi:hypothetical protein EK21DRAFT_99554 [Setomelanomma holmii]|uniref:Amino acid permease/ SLC12A domain-containing protein n=1 Tax=Setomelanomma holmii TaxID=210430 RepID=A0A9P4HBL5_9PLEO|nr:hypothetical protein EK21DRAFT_99554 [Setomelanomma holmii]
MALAGIIGPGILVGTGGALANGGPAALLIGFGIIGIIAFSITQSLGEMTTLYSTGEALVTLSDRFVDKAFGVAVGWQYWLVWACVLANEYNVISSLMVFWSDKVPSWGYFLIFWSAFLAFQMIGVESFGETEFWLALIKLLGLFIYFVFSIIYVSGDLIGQTEAIGFRYWHDPGAFANGFRGAAQVFVFASTFYAGVEAVPVAATETHNPSVAVPLAIRQVIWRILFEYMGVAFFFGLTCPSDADGLVNRASRALKSPMTINAGWEGGVHLINAFIFITVLSTIMFMAQEKMAPKFLGKTNARGVPYPAIIFTNLFGFLSWMNLSTRGGKAYGYIVNLSGVSTFLVWGAISFTHTRFRNAWAAQGRTPDQLPFKSFAYPWNLYFGLIANIFLALVQGWTTLSPFDAGTFVDAYILLPLFGIIYAGYKFWFKTRFWRGHEIDLDAGMRKDLDLKEEVLHGEQGDAAQMLCTQSKHIRNRTLRGFNIAFLGYKVLENVTAH